MKHHYSCRMQWALVGLTLSLLFGTSPIAAQVFSADHFTTGEVDLPYRLFSPSRAGIETTLPLVLVLHGRSYTGTDNESQLQPFSSRIWVSEGVQSTYPCFVLIPQLPPDRRWEDSFGKLDESDSAPFLDGICALIDSLQNHHLIDANRIYIVGVSLGAHGAWGMLARHPGRFAAALIIAGRLVYSLENQPGGIPAWIFHGNQDRTVPVEEAREAVRIIEEGGRTVLMTDFDFHLKKAADVSVSSLAEQIERGIDHLYSEYDGAGHVITGRILQNPIVYTWLFSKRRGR